MSKISMIKFAAKQVFKGIKYKKNPEEMQLFHSFNPIVGDKLVYNGKKLANGPRTFSKELKKIGCNAYDIEKIIEHCEQNPELYPQFSAMLMNIKPEHIDEYAIKELFIEFANYCKINPKSTSDIKDYGILYETLKSKDMERKLSLKDILKENITDFKTISMMANASTHSVYQIPKIIKESKIPKEELCKIYKNHMSLTEEGSLYSAEINFTEFLKILNETPQRADEFSKILEKLAKDKTLNKKFYNSELFSIYKYLKEDWQIDVIKKYKQLSNYIDVDFLRVIKNSNQANFAFELAKKNEHTTALKAYYSVVEKGIVDSQEQLEAYKFLFNKKMNGAIKSDSMHRFSTLAKENICKKIKSQTDLEILKLMVEKQSVKGEDLYSTHAILKVLEQDESKKLKILEKLKLQRNINMKAYNEGLKHRDTILQQDNYSCLERNALSDYGVTVTNKPPFKSEVRTLSEKLSDTEVLKTLKAGEVANVGERLVVSDGEKLFQLKMDKAMFEKLFVSDENIMQGFLGDCGCVSTLDALTNTPKGKVAIYKLFEQVGDDIYINLSGFDKKIKFEGGNYSAQRSLMSMFKGANGIKMLEQAIAISKHFTGEKLQGNIINAYKDVAEGHDWNRMMNSLKRIYPKYILEKIFNKKDYTTIDNCTPVYCTINKIEKLKELNPQNNKFAIYGTTTSVDGITEERINRWNLCLEHYHNIKRLDKFGKLTLTNPNDASFSCKVPVYEALNDNLIENLILCELL